MVANVIVVVVDALRADRVGTGSGLTPNIDAIAADGTAFENAFTCSPNTDPSLTAIETGRYPLSTVYHHGKLVTDEEKRRVESVRPIQSVLRDDGWRTVVTGQHLGRWHARGFDHYPESDPDTDTTDSLVQTAHSLYRAVDRYAPALGALARRLYDAASESKPQALIHEDHSATDLLNHVDEEPFFGLVHLMDTHMPYLSAEDDVERLLNTGEYEYGSLDDRFDDDALTDAQRTRLTSIAERFDAREELGRAVAHYDAAVVSADRKIGRLVDALREQNRWEETALFITSDHGESLLEHGIFFDHHGLHDAVMRVPLVCSLGSGQTRSEFVQEIDLAPTVYDVLGVENRPATDGQSLRPLIDDTDDWDERDAVYAEEAYTERRVAVRTPRWKYIHHVEDDVLASERGSSLECGYCETVHGEEVALYDVETDPSETANAAGNRPSVVASLDERYAAFVDELESVTDENEPVAYADEGEVLNRLRSLGYK
ncbi:sulfatase family protein [Haloarcula pellucida]|uniref:Sulfatase N-terminal domain-containing protein n=1 Tax=Haloarcula pellucida TaxID=1427151 RepID=A0A830GKT8_9EURY|nr:sulfatase [Halomicroarcula pellucida]MBX0348707.1 sulfatase-like hydrolase/transferase [Halomicroarcula pellucida]GGN92130.1 hypothetical protein GCM10009030_16020 [Halomicroarcula pellucida]